MKNAQHDALLEQALDIRAARTLCREGWSCEQINSVLKKADITDQQFAMMQTQSREFDKLQQVFGPPADSLYSGHAEPTHSAIDFLNRGPDAATDILKDKGWSGYEISLVLEESMFTGLEEAPIAVPSNSYHRNPPIIIQPAFPTHSDNGYVVGHSDAATLALPHPGSRALPRRNSRRSLSRDTFILTCMAAFALVLIYTLL
ncbi:hypothetical protein IQ260_09240 [Leptolyngbya cf. ectocarpi LEGE 11479]|uniref:Uncharacterized protein n=1 Tax=Leptolyngbya cf. ectocarpi LEGE 11479 TaxID=1828722 RepID=A0A928ZTA4_LEPEC|nr:hypothetical protein [Leptolyngbya ectocarpi]MBE9066836.1 hypothetical protein [Leptolyngbya cf. ectocarpi LEGE 11479]